MCAYKMVSRYSAIVLFVVLVVRMQLSMAGNILFITGVPSPSHYMWCRAIFNELVNKGHNVTVLSTDLEEIKNDKLHYYHLDRVYEVFQDDSSINFIEMGQMNPLIVTYEFAELVLDICRASIESQGFKKIMAYPDNFKFDAVIYDYMAGSCLLVLLEKFNNPPLIALTAFIAPSTAVTLTGASFYPSSVPNPQMEFDVEMNLLERITNTLMYVTEYYFNLLYAVPKVDQYIRSLYPSTPYVSELEQRAQIVLLNSNPILDYVEPFLPNVIGVGGLQIAKAKKLPDNLQKIFDGARKGVILFSLGTNVRSDTLGEERLIKIIKAFAHLSAYEIIWKFESDALPIRVPVNVHILEWVPQNDILANPKTVLFVTHSGMLSTQEAIWHAVPMVGFPIFGDQFQNINRCVKFGIAKRLSILDFTSTELRNTIQTVLNDDRIRNNIQERSRIFRDQPQPPLERAIWWIEWVLRYPKNQSLHSPSMNLGILARHSVDVIVILAGIIFTIIVIFFNIIKCCLSRCADKRKTDKLKKH